jgi:bbp48
MEADNRDEKIGYDIPMKASVVVSALDKQVGGNHYKQFPIQPVEFINANNLSYMQGNVIKYVVRYPFKNGIADLEKAKHYIEMLIEFERNKQLDEE